jgi:hypothetical protein
VCKQLSDFSHENKELALRTTAPVNEKAGDSDNKKKNQQIMNERVHPV